MKVGERGRGYKMAQRYKLGKSYVVRDRKGQFYRFSRIGRSLMADRRKKAMKKVKSGYGHIGDQRITKMPNIFGKKNFRV